MNLVKYLAADRDRSVFFTGITILSTCAAVISVSNGLYMLTAVFAGGAIVGLIGLLLKVVIELATPVINTAIQAMTGRFRRFEDTTYNRTYHP